MSNEEFNRQGAKNAKKEPDKRVDLLAHEIIGAAIEVHRMLGPGYLENVYEQALGLELTHRGMPFERQKPIPVLYKGHKIGQGRIDLLVAATVVVELKTVEILAPIHRAQVLSYLKASKLSLGLLINFNVLALKHGIERIVRTF